ncbi:DUF6527 family protein [Chitinophaga eiseniae]|uniref:DUF6527 family protein n=1 Tax=Chitinophaga eiseniae TaxID=634771 RepID=UPI0009993B5C|nr:DUF6527 family protein [Chitinophaga eiseniae]
MKMLQHKFVEFIPDNIDDGVIYISINYCTAIHKCVCGCGNEVVTPISPTDWRLTFDRKTVSLHPSIGNWSFSCQSHYWIKNNKIQFATKWDSNEISINRQADSATKNNYYTSRMQKSEPKFPDRSKRNIPKLKRFLRSFLKIFGLGT